MAASSWKRPGRSLMELLAVLAILVLLASLLIAAVFLAL